jgi:genetic interactor of prohibitins 3, mitochondrial
VRTYLRSRKREAERSGRATVVAEPSDQEAEDYIPFEHVEPVNQPVVEEAPPSSPPVCDRCHYLIHDSRGTPIAHPSVEAIADSIAESPFARNHVYHVMDAADFPMSLVPSIFRQLSLARPRSQNRRSQHSFSTRPELSFIITRSDLIAPTKEMVDSMMPKFTAVLRTALGRVGRNIRLGNVHLVSSKRGWWTKDIKDTIRSRGGGNWLVGKFNVGKSNLFEVIFPKGSRESTPVHAELRQRQENDPAERSLGTSMLSENALLPPSQPEVPYPTMPLVSSLPGTTASPIRLPFGNRKGELIDMPGLERGGLDQYVKDEAKLGLVMVNRPTVVQHVIKRGQSLLLGGGLVSISPVFDDTDASMTVLAYPFVPLKAHVTSSVKAEAAQMQLRGSGIESILGDGAGLSMASAGHFKLETDVTKSRAGSMIRAGVNIDKLPFRIYATDILIEGVGWVELVCQVRKRKRSPEPETSPSEVQHMDSAETTVPVAEEVSFDTTTFSPFGGSKVIGDESPSTEAVNFPEVEVFAPRGKFIGQRACLDIWQMWDTGKPSQTNPSARPRKSMKGAKKREKMARRNAAGT